MFNAAVCSLGHGPAWQYMRADANEAEVDAVLDALGHNTRVQALYIQNFELVCAYVRVVNFLVP